MAEFWAVATPLIIFWFSVLILTNIAGMLYLAITAEKKDKNDRRRIWQ